MKYCIHCGKEVSEDTAICPCCGNFPSKRERQPVEKIPNKPTRFSVTAIVGFILMIIGVATAIAFLFLEIEFPIDKSDKTFLIIIVSILTLAMFCNSTAIFVAKSKNRRGVWLALSGIICSALSLIVILLNIISL